MSLTSYRAAPSRANSVLPSMLVEERLVNGLSYALAAKPGDDLLFHCLSNSTIGAVWFHGRVRDGIGWVTDAMATKLWSQRKGILEIVHFLYLVRAATATAKTVVDGGILKRE
jgi:hypothetical protein